jgi:hypothetical protein
MFVGKVNYGKMEKTCHYFSLVSLFLYRPVVWEQKEAVRM